MLVLVLDLIDVVHVFSIKVALLKLLVHIESLLPYGSWAPFHLELLPFCALQIDYFNNQIIVDLVEQQHKGIIAILDDACMNVGKVTDEMFLEALNSKLGKHGHFSSRKVICLMRTFFHFDL